MSDLELMDFKKQIFAIKDSNEKGCIIYAPLKKVCFWVDNEYGDLISEFLLSSDGLEMFAKYKELYERINSIYMMPSEKPAPREFRIRNHLILILSERCNFNCSYCYAQKAHSKDVISWTSICKAVDAVMHSSGKIVRITFIGGGEPLVTYELIQKTVEYAEKISLQYQKRVIFSVTTNASLISENIAKWMSEHAFRVSVSFEILPTIQNFQRPLLDGRESFKLVDRGIESLLSVGIVPRFRATITNTNVALMSIMVQYVVDNYSSVKKLHFEPVSDNSQSLERFYREYMKHFIEAKKLAKENGIQLSNSITTSMKQLKEVFCAGEFCVVPNGSFVACHRVSSVNDTHYASFKVCDGDKDYDFRDSILIGQTQVPLGKECECCFARWHCAGGCAYNRLSYNDRQMKAFCKFTKEMVKKILEGQLNLEYA